jgi:hypothetical protein
MTITLRRSTRRARPFLALLAFTTLLITPATASATLLSTLLVPGATLDVGTLEFGGFNYLITGDMPGAGNVNVVPYTDGSGNVGLLFQGSFLDFLGGGGSDAVIGFSVTERDSAKLVSGRRFLAIRKCSAAAVWPASPRRFCRPIRISP